MAKSKFIAIVASAALVAMLGLSACGGQASSSAASASSSSSTTASASASSSTTASTTATAANTLVSWEGALSDGTLVDFVSSDDMKKGALVLSKEKGSDTKSWSGDMTITDDKTVTITDDKTKESVTFTRDNATREGAVLISVEGYGKGAVVPMTAADWEKVAEAEKLAETLGTVVNTFGVFQDGSLVIYTQNQEGTKAAVGVLPKGSSQMKTWVGNTSTENGKQVVTDDKSKETFAYTWTENPSDGTVTVEADGYGKGLLVKMSVADWMILDEYAKANKIR